MPEPLYRSRPGGFDILPASQNEAEKILAVEMPMLPIYFYVRSSLRQPSVKGWWPNVLDHHPFKHVYLED